MENFYTKVLILTLLIVWICSSNMYAQEETVEHNEEKHLIALALGYSYIPEGSEVDQHETTGVFIPSIGLDYMYRIHQKWEIGLMADVELGSYVIRHKELNRENAFVIAAVGLYKISNGWSVFGGAGIELEKNKNFAILRLGTDYSFSLGKGWIAAPGFSYDLKEGYDSWSISVAIGKGFEF